MDTATASVSAEIEFRGGHHPSAVAVRRALTAFASGPDTPALPAIVDATPLAAADSAQALQIVAAAADLLCAAPPPADLVGGVVFLLPPHTDGPAAIAAIRRLARHGAPHWRLNAIRIGRSAEDTARTAAFALACHSFTGQFVALDQPPQASMPPQPDPRVADPLPAASSGMSDVSGTREVMIRDLVLPCRVGVRRHERDAPQRVRVNLKLVVDETPLHDRLEDVVCYDDIVDHIRRVATGGHVNLVETLAERIADGCFLDRRVRSARVAVEKLDVYPDATAAGVRIVRRRADRG